MIVKKIPTDGYASNCWLLVSGGEAAIVDPSAPPEAVRGAVGDKNVRYIILTHGHFDHMLSLGETREEYGAPLLIHRGDADFLTDPAKNLFLPFFGKKTVFAPADRLLGDGDAISLGDETVTVVHTPGHTPGSASFLSGGVILTGDTLFFDSVGRTDFPGGDAGTLARSLAALSALPGALRVYPGHGPDGALSKIKEINPYLRCEL
ncbi:MAG: MBL fold metallo-hydrolase [Clostridia bacterium]|nr:MBL fold metallo-hydrolase [Clostridia bacterium]